MTATDTFRAARDLLQSVREDYDTARSEFRWPELETFNWALDWFDVPWSRRSSSRRCGSTTARAPRTGCPTPS